MKTAHASLSKREQARARRKRQQMLPVALMVAGALVLVVVLVFAFTSSGGNQAVRPAQIGAPLSDFTLKDISGKQVSLSDYKGQVVLVNAWATWCPPCRAEMPALNAYYQQHAQDGFVILAVNAGESVSQASSFAQEKGLAFPVLLDPQMALLDGLFIRSYPTSILVGRDGRIMDIQVGMFTSAEEIEAKITPLLQ